LSSIAPPKDLAIESNSRNAAVIARRRGADTKFIINPAPILAWIALGILCEFFWTKVNLNEEGTGWLLLPFFVSCFAVVAFIRLGSGAWLYARASALPACATLLYIVARVMLDAPLPSDVFNFTVGYTNGVVFSYTLGNCVRFLVDTAACGSTRQSCLCCAGFLLYSLSWPFRNISDTQSQALFLGQRALIQNESYQVSGSLLASISIVIGAVTISVISRTSNAQKAVRFCLLLLLMAMYAVFVWIGQVLGSNAAPAFIAGLGLVLAACLIPELSKNWARCFRVFGLPACQAGCARDRLIITFINLLAISSLCFSVFIVMIAMDWFDVTRYRAFGFEDGNPLNSSILSRLAILEDNLLLHFDYSPVFGDFFVDRFTTGEGTYVHSLIAVLPHLGVVGSLLVLWLLSAVALQMTLDVNRAASQGRGLLAPMAFLIAALWAIAFVLAANFFTSITLWLSIGVFAPAIQLGPTKKTARGLFGIGVRGDISPKV
jgi:hypothetical protein